MRPLSASAHLFYKKSMTNNIPSFAPLRPGRAQPPRGFVRLLLGLAADCGVLALSAGAVLWPTAKVHEPILYMIPSLY
jgi:hypothetical protein